MGLHTPLENPGTKQVARQALARNFIITSSLALLSRRSHSTLPLLRQSFITAWAAWRSTLILPSLVLRARLSQVFMPQERLLEVYMETTGWEAILCLTAWSLAVLQAKQQQNTSWV